MADPGQTPAMVLAETRPAELLAGRAIVEAIGGLVRELGWVAALYGSTLACGRGRDVDVLLAPTKSDAAPAGDVVRTLLEVTSFEVLLDQENDVARGIVGRWHGYAVDLTIANRGNTEAQPTTRGGPQ